MTGAILDTGLSAPALTGAFALVGVVVGAVVSGVVQWKLGVRRENWELARQRDGVRRQVRQASRLLVIELQEVLAYAELGESRLDSVPPDAETVTEVWATYRELLATHLGGAVWQVVVDAVAVAEYANQAFGERGGGNGGAGGIVSDDIVRTVAEELRRGIDVLAEAAGVNPEPPSVRLRL